MLRQELAKHIKDLEVAIKETDETIKDAYLISEYMVEPNRSEFILQLKLKETQLNMNRMMLESFKLIYEGDDKNER